ncbi:MAG: hypothetical protein ACHQYQ_06995 [Bacteriovoracales bacterium]
MSLKKLGALLILLGLMGCRGGSSSPQSPDDLPIVGLGKDGETVISYIPKGKHLRKLSSLMGEISDKSTQTLSKFEFDEKFKLTRVSVGLEVAVEFGLTDFLEWEIAPAVDLRFEPLPHPTI